MYLWLKSMAQLHKKSNEIPLAKCNGLQGHEEVLLLEENNPIGRDSHELTLNLLNH